MNIDITISVVIERSIRAVLKEGRKVVENILNRHVVEVVADVHGHEGVSTEVLGRVHVYILALLSGVCKPPMRITCESYEQLLVANPQCKSEGNACCVAQLASPIGYKPQRGSSRALVAEIDTPTSDLSGA